MTSAIGESTDLAPASMPETRSAAPSKVPSGKPRIDQVLEEERRGCVAEFSICRLAVACE